MFNDIKNTIAMKEDSTGWKIGDERYDVQLVSTAIKLFMEHHDLYGMRSFKDLEGGKLYLAYLNVDHYAEVLELFVN